MMKVENISAGYGKKQVLFEVSFEVKQGEIVLIVGSNGSGKSTLLKALYGILPLSNNGQIIFAGDNITGKPTAGFLRKGLHYIPQKNNLFENLTVKENLEIAGLTLGKRTLQQRIEYSLSIFTELGSSLHRTPLKLSGGERQLLTLAMATLHQPKMILLDEPFNGLSPQNLNFVSEYLRGINQKSGISLLIVEHRVKECLKISNRVIGLKFGKVFSQTEVNSMFDSDELNSVFV